MLTRILTTAGAALAAAALTGPAPVAAQPAAQPAAPGGDGTTGRLEVYAGPGIGYRELRVGDGCHDFDSTRSITFADAEPMATYAFYTGPDCTGRVVGTGRDDSQWMPPLNGVRSVHIDFE
ncbi:hypothetical protein [Streptomonospora litoralis]|uniref:Beta/gamma crystallin 'Greek key' domain-containing protein n=1 Tax=Streptomonospora litoralis TaxID=2498135 RepID=A0A4P6Q119_9ACTN|nr:hypothetical protein [Streptomonospora litoralis]QBI52267.1 hypothetical protein EKD16_02255 [Streptomonospora litoralis]